MVQAYEGDGICAYFGVPAAHEDDPERAARAGLRILEVVAEYARDVEAAWGLAVFAVRVGDQHRAGGRGARRCGRAGSRCSRRCDQRRGRIQSLAEPGTIVVGEANRPSPRASLRLRAARRLRGEGPRSSGLGLPARRPESPRARCRRDARSSGATPRWRSSWARSATSSPAAAGSCCSWATPGMGKTRLLAELRGLAEDRVVWLEGHCLSYGGLAAWPFVEALLGWLGADVGEAEIAVRTKARAKLGALLGPELDDVLPSLGRLLRLRVDATEDAGSAERIREAYVRWLEAVARQQPVVVALEDVHWADTADAGARRGGSRARRAGADRAGPHRGGRPWLRRSGASPAGARRARPPNDPDRARSACRTTQPTRC